MNGFSALIARDVTLALRSGGGAAQSAIFFALTTLLFGLAIGPDVKLLAELAAPILWAGVLLASLVSLDRIFHADFEDGALDAIIEASDILALPTLAKAIAHWLTACLPLIVVSPLLAILVSLPADAYGRLFVSLLVGTPALSFVGAFSAAVALALRRAGILMAILAAPLYAPTLIFGVGAAGDGGQSSLLLLAAISLFSLLVAPIGAAAALRLNLN